MKKTFCQGLKLKYPMHWPKTLSEARKIQDSLKDKVRVEPLRKTPRYIAGVDAAFTDSSVIASACLYLYPEIEFLHSAVIERKITFPYVPGFLTFREGPAIIEAIKGLRPRVDLLIFDGQGIAHPRGIGLASHIGVILNIPSIGCAKSRLVGSYKEPKDKRGSSSPLIYDSKIVGSVLRTRQGVKPLFISPGHLIDIKSAKEIVLRASIKYRIPEPQRCAHILAEKYKSAKIHL